MARRPIFCPQPSGNEIVKERIIDFIWHSGLSKSQAQKSIDSLHHAAAQGGIQPILEISSKSPTDLGVNLSAFNLFVDCGDYGRISVEAAYQGSKVFRGGRQFIDIYGLSAREAKTDERIRTSGDLESFIFMNVIWPLDPQTAFYDWFYMSALSQNPDLSEQLIDYQGFSDIAFNPERSINCQARSAARYVALQKRGLLEQALANQAEFLTLMGT